MTEVVWGGFLAFFLTLLFLDLSVLHRESAELSVKQALFWTAVWVSVAMSFTLVIYGLYEHRWLGFVPGPGVRDGADAVVLFVTGYLLEWSLSVDNIFVIALIFSYLKIPALYQYRVLFWGIVGAIVLRGVMIITGAALLSRLVAKLEEQLLDLSVQALGLGRNLAAAGGVGPVGVGQRLAFGRELLDQPVPVLVRQSLPTEGALCLTRFPLQ